MWSVRPWESILLAAAPAEETLPLAYKGLDGQLHLRGSLDSMLDSLVGGFGVDGTMCWKGSYGRGVGKPISACSKSHPQKKAGLCYKKCKKNYDGVGPVCWQHWCVMGYALWSLRCALCS